MTRHLGLARTICRSCGAEQLAPVSELVADAALNCPSCGDNEPAASILARYRELAELVGLLRDLRRMGSGQVGRGGADQGGQDGEAAPAARAAVAQKERV